MDDLQIIELYWLRDEDAISESGAKYGHMLKRISLNILSNHEDSEECVNDTYEKAWNTMPPHHPNCLSAFLGRITRNLSINRWHENHTKKRGGAAGADVLLSELSDCIPASQTTEAEIDLSIVTEVIAKWLSSLSQDDRVLFLRRYWFGDTLKALAEESLTTPVKLAGRIYRLRKKLKETLEKEEILL